MKKSVLLALLLFLFPLVLFCESFEMGFLNHDNQNIVIREETVKINEDNIESSIVIQNLQNKKNSGTFTLSCKQNGYGKSYTESLIPENLCIYINKKQINFEVKYQGKNYTKEEAKNVKNFDESQIYFSLALKPNELKKLVISYKNISYDELHVDDSRSATLVQYNFNPETTKKEVVYQSKDKTKKLRYFIFYTEQERIIPNNSIRYIEKSDCEWKISVPEEVNKIGIQFYLFLPFEDMSVFRLVKYDGKLYSIYNEKLLNSELLSLFDLFYLSKEQLAIMRNSIYAVHGYEFKDPKWKKYFGEIYSFYKVNPNFSETDFNDIEKKNIELIRYMENTTETLLLSDYVSLEEE